MAEPKFYNPGTNSWESLKGEQGEQGPTGEQGPRGEQGPQGPDPTSDQIIQAVQTIGLDLGEL